ncbi:MAG: IS1380 family transposase [Gammaproteobacteria bacterium]|nr:IS1380 family transposase [Gammaproteobacteria bacterium]
MTKGYQKTFEFPRVNRRVVEANFDGGDITSDGGVLLLRQADRLVGLSAAITRALTDPRRAASCDHDLESLLRQRVYAIALGYEDLNDHEALRQDVALQTAVERDQSLASASTLCRFENQADRESAWRLHEVLVDQFVASFKRAPKKLILDFDATDDPVHGEQDGRFFHGYYRHYCFLPLYVFCGHQLLVSYLRPSNIDGAKHSWAILSLLVKRLRQVWPKVKIVFRGDGGFCRWKMLRWCDHHDIGYIVGLPKNKRLNRFTTSLQDEAAACFAATGQKIRWFTECQYAAKSWDQPRRVIAKIEYSSQGVNPRYVVTNLEGDAKYLYDKLYCARGDMENRIKENQLDMFGGRTSCQRWWPNQFRLLLSSLAYTLIEAIRRIALHGTELAKAYVGTIRLKLFKIGAVILKNTRRIRFLLASGCPYKELYFLVAHRLATG